MDEKLPLAKSHGSADVIKTCCFCHSVCITLTNHLLEKICCKNNNFYEIKKPKRLFIRNRNQTEFIKSMAARYWSGLYIISILSQQYSSNMVVYEVESAAAAASSVLFHSLLSAVCLSHSHNVV